MTDLSNIKRAHCVGIGGIHVSAVARLLKSRGVEVTGSDAVASDETVELEKEGIAVKIGHAAGNIPQGAEAVIYSHAVPEDNPELAEARKRGIVVFDTHAFLGELFKAAKQIVVTGTHGKSTTTAMIGKIFEAAGENPTVVVGTRVPGFEGGNLRVGRTDLLIVEGDEYRSHVLSYRPTILVLNNIDWDHPDVFPTVKDYVRLFRSALERIRPKGILIANIGSRTVDALLDQEDIERSLDARNIKVVTFSTGEHGQWRVSRFANIPGLFGMVIQDNMGERITGKGDFQLFNLQVPGAHNARNAAGAALAAIAMDLDRVAIATALSDFTGVWRRFEKVGTYNDAMIISDYGHHPAEIRETLKATRDAYPDRRIVLCFQPHQHARTKGLFDDFVKELEKTDVLVLAEIYDVPGREEKEDRDVTSEKLLDAIGRSGARFYAATPEDAESRLRAIVQAGDVVLVMGAGTIDRVARRLVRK